MTTTCAGQDRAQTDARAPGNGVPQVDAARPMPRLGSRIASCLARFLTNARARTGAADVGAQSQPPVEVRAQTSACAHWRAQMNARVYASAFPHAALSVRGPLARVSLPLGVASILIATSTGCRDEQALPRPPDAPFARGVPPPQRPVELRELNVVRVENARAPVIDGALDDAAWADAQESVLRDSLTGEDTAPRTAMRWLRDERHLYIAFECEDPDVWGTHRTRDAPLYEEEVVEVFLAPWGVTGGYAEIEVSPRNAVFDASFTGPRLGMDLGFDAGVTSAVKVAGTLDERRDRDAGWTVELKIPLARLPGAEATGPLRAEAAWRFNVFRLERPRKGPVRGQAFSPPLVGDFHRVDRFGVLRFPD